MRHRLDLRKIRKRWDYSVKEVSDTLSVHVGTVQRWIRHDGLKPLEGTQHPYFIRGSVLLEFLAERLKQQKCPLKPDESYCVRCKVGRKGRPECEEIIKTGKRLRGGKLHGRMAGICEVCGSKINRWFSYM